jgi:hypothetical protein
MKIVYDGDEAEDALLWRCMGKALPDLDEFDRKLQWEWDEGDNTDAEQRLLDKIWDWWNEAYADLREKG